MYRLIFVFSVTNFGTSETGSCYHYQTGRGPPPSYHNRGEKKWQLWFYITGLYHLPILSIIYYYIGVIVLKICTKPKGDEMKIGFYLPFPRLFSHHFFLVYFFKHDIRSFTFSLGGRHYYSAMR